MSAGSISAEGVGVRFLFDRHERAVTPALARLRRTSTQTWGVHELDFTIGPGEGVALIGPSGSGKTTVLRLIAGVLSPDAGTLDVRGQVGARRPLRDHVVADRHHKVGCRRVRGRGLGDDREDGPQARHVALPSSPTVEPHSRLRVDATKG